MGAIEEDKSLRLRVSACLVTHNEEANIGRCLKSLDWVNEIVIIDDFSTDATVEIASAFSGRIFRHPWKGHIEQKNFAIDQASCDWVFCIDADEEVSPELRQAILEVLRKNTRAAGYFVPRRVRYLGTWINHSGWYPDYKLRLFKRSAGRWSGINPHDCVQLHGKAEYLRGDLYHYPYRDLSDHLSTMNHYTSISAQELHIRGRRFQWRDLFFHPLARFIRMFFLKFGFMDGIRGLILAILGAVYVFQKYLKLWELQNAK